MRRNAAQVGKNLSMKIILIRFVLQCCPITRKCLIFKFTAKERKQPMPIHPVAHTNKAQPDSGPLIGGPWCRLSVLRNGNVACRI